MPRAEDIPSCPTKPTATVNPGHTYDIELITPMVGGGASPGAVDLNNPIRPTAIRGQLRHWWRLVGGHLLGAAMWQREEEIFGSTEFPSPTTVAVLSPTPPERFDPSDENVVERFGPVAYALFAAIENNHLVTHAGLRFTLQVQTALDSELLQRRKAQNEQRRKARKTPLPDSITPIGPEVEKALAAWLSFGGIGGRTRRGCGSLHCNKNPIPLSKIPGRIFVGPAQSSALDAWKTALALYREFRQTPRGKKHKKTLKSGKIANVDGRSHWPEADSIRKITGCSLKPPPGTPASGVPVDEDTHDHSTPVVPNSLLPAFPKAVLGLPINFHFADGPNRGPASANLDPKDVQLYPLVPTQTGRLEKAERMASPIITRPIWKDGKWFPAIIVLKQDLPAGFGVRIEGRNATVVGNLSKDLPVSCVVDGSMGAVVPMRGKANAIDALVSFLETRQFKEVSQ